MSGLLSVDPEVVAQRVRRTSSSTDTLTRGEFELSAGVPDERQRVASFKAYLPHLIRSGVVADISIVAYEEFQADSSAGNQEQFNLSHSFVESGAVAEPAVAYENDSPLAVDSYDEENNTVTVTPANADSTIGIFYTSDEQARVQVQKTAPNGVHEVLWGADIGNLHYRDHGKKPVEFDLNRSFWQRYVPKDWEIEVYVDAPYTARMLADVGGDGNDESATNAALDIPVAQATQEIPGLDEVVRADASVN